MSIQLDPRKIRKEMRLKRACISSIERHRRSLRAFRHLKRSGLLNRHKKITAYLSDRGEIAPDAFFEELWSFRKSLILPVLHPIDRNRMIFVRYNKGDALQANRYGILEPKLTPKKIVPAQFCGLVLCPLTAFDEKGNRLGMGGGFYDRSFAFRNKRTSTLPFLAGFAYDFQKVAKLPHQPWDVSLDAVITDQSYYITK